MNIFYVILILIFSQFIGALGSIYLKKGSASFNIKISYQGFINILKNWQVILGISLYLLSTVFTIMLLRTEKLSFIYPFSSLTYIFVIFLSAMLLKEHINIYKFFGISAIILGVILVAI